MGKIVVKASGGQEQNGVIVSQRLVRAMVGELAHDVIRPWANLNKACLSTFIVYL